MFRKCTFGLNTSSCTFKNFRILKVKGVRSSRHLRLLYMQCLKIFHQISKRFHSLKHSSVFATFNSLNKDHNWPYCALNVHYSILYISLGHIKLAAIPRCYTSCFWSCCVKVMSHSYSCCYSIGSFLCNTAASCDNKPQ